MTEERIKELAEKYIKGFYCRLDGDERDWGTYKESEIEYFVGTFRDMVAFGHEILDVHHVYMNSRALVAIIEVKFQVEFWLKESQWEEEGSWYEDLVTEAGNDVIVTMGPSDEMIIVVESY